MTQNYHTPIPSNAQANAASINSPLGQLDAAIADVIATQVEQFSRLRFDPATLLTISGGSITTTQSLHIIAAQTSTTDDLDTITAVNNSLLFLKADTGDTITIVEGGNIVNATDGLDFSGDVIVALFCENDVWSVIGVSGGGSAAAFSGARIFGPDIVTSLTDTNASILDYDTEDYDTDAYATLVSNNTQFTIPTNGLFRITANVRISCTGTPNGPVHLFYSASGTATIFPAGQSIHISEAGTYWLSFTTVGEINATALIGANLDNDSGVTITIVQNSLEIERLGDQIP